MVNYKILNCREQQKCLLQSSNQELELKELNVTMTT